MENPSRHDDDTICRSIAELLPLYIDGALDPDDMAKVETHLIACPACAREKNEMLEIMHILNSVEEVPVPKEFDLRLKSAIRKDKTRISVFRWKALSALAAGIFVIFISYSIMNDMLTDIGPDEGATMMTKDAALSDTAPAASEEIQSFSAAPETAAPADGSSDLTRIMEQPDYYQLISDSLDGYQYAIISDLPEKGEIRIMILSDKSGNPINREFVVQYADGRISSTDNWLGIDFD